jgi:uncharacterized membrane protein YgcG
MRAVSHRAVFLLLGLLLPLVLPLVNAAPAAAAPAYPEQATCADPAAALDTATCARITQVLRDDQRATGDALAVAVVRTTGGLPINAWGAGLFNAWRIAQRSRSAVLVVAVAEHQPDLVSSDALASKLPAGTVTGIIRGQVTPLLVSGQVRDAVLTGLDAVRRALGHPVTQSNSLGAAAHPPGTVRTGPPRATLPSVPLPSSAPTAEPDNGGGNRLAWLALLCCLAALAVGGYIRRMRRTRGARYLDLPNRQRPWWAQERRWWSGVLPGSAVEVGAPARPGDSSGADPNGRAADGGAADGRAGDGWAGESGDGASGGR